MIPSRNHPPMDRRPPRWYNVRFLDQGVKRLHQPVAGDLSLAFETMQL